jgi:hypothetical protein
MSVGEVDTLSMQKLLEKLNKMGITNLGRQKQQSFNSSFSFFVDKPSYS